MPMRTFFLRVLVVVLAYPATVAAPVTSWRPETGARAIARGRPALEPRGAPGGSVSGQHERGAVMYYGVTKFRVYRPATLLGFDLPTVDPGLKIVAVRAVFIGFPAGKPGASGHLNIGGWPGAICTSRWPPRGFGPTYPVAGLTVEPGDLVGLVAWIAPRDPRQLGTHTADGYQLRFHADGYDQQILHRRDMKIVITYVDKRDPRCHRPHDVWTHPDPRFPA